jgi:fructokinase
MTKYGGIESGGSKWECAIATGPEDFCAVTTIPTTTPKETIGRAVDFFSRAGPVDAIGIGSFGPVDTRIDSMTWGYITTTPKPGWANTDVGQEIRRRLDVPVAFDTDVNAAALGEHRWGAGRELRTLWYVTVGSGIGGGAIVDGRVLHGLFHPEFGHLRVPHDLDADPFDGVCPYHGDCLEGLASGPALEARWGIPPAQIEDGNAWMLEARYLALGLVAVISVLSPERIVVGGGVAKHPGLLASVRQEVTALMNGYLGFEASDDYVTPPTFGARAGVLGAIALAESASVSTAPSPGSVLSRDR